MRKEHPISILYFRLSLEIPSRLIITMLFVQKMAVRNKVFSDVSSRHKILRFRSYAPFGAIQYGQKRSIVLSCSVRKCINS